MKTNELHANQIPFLFGQKTLQFFIFREIRDPSVSLFHLLYRVIHNVFFDVLTYIFISDFVFPPKIG